MVTIVIRWILFILIIDNNCSGYGLKAGNKKIKHCNILKINIKFVNELEFSFQFHDH